VGIASGSWGYGGVGIAHRLSGRVSAIVGRATSGVAGGGGMTDSCGTGGGALAISISISSCCFSVMSVPIVAHRSWSSRWGGGGGRVGGGGWLAGSDRAIVGSLRRRSSFLLTADSGS